MPVTTRFHECGSSVSNRPIRVVLADDESLFRASLRQLLAVPANVLQGRLRRQCRTRLRGDWRSRHRRRCRPGGAGRRHPTCSCSICACRACPDWKRCASCRRVAIACASSCWLETSIAAQLVSAVRLGVRGLLLKDAPTEVLFEAIMCVMAGQYWLGQSLVSDLLEIVRPLIQSSGVTGNGAAVAG